MHKQTLKKKEAKLPKENLKGKLLENSKFSFKASKLNGLKDEKENKGARVGISASLSFPTSLQFGPDGRLYVSEQYGQIKVFTIVRNSSNNYTITNEEVISLINEIPNHNDDGTLAPHIKTRQVTGLVVTGTPTVPVLYVSSSDSRIGGPSGDQNLDTNSGIISKLTKTASGWDKVDLIRGLPRSEENHSNNGMQLDGNTLYVIVGGNTNAGSPSTNFAYASEYALTTAVLSIDLAAIEALPTQGSGNTKYKYDLPTLDDPTRAGNPDAGDPFGGNDGLNQAKVIPGGPVKVFATGFRNGYDLVITKTPGKSRRMYVIDNGANQGWGGHPASEGVGTATNNYVSGEPGSTGSGPNDPQVNNRDNLHYIGNLDTYVPGSFYGGHPNPIRANPAGAGLYTHDGSSGVWRTTKSGNKPLPADWPPVPLDMAHPIEGDYQNPGETDNALLTWFNSTNGIAEYTASNFNSGLQGHLLAASFDGTIQKISLNESGTDVTNSRGDKKLNQDLPFASNFGGQPLDITTQGDNDIFPGTVWVVCYLENSIFVFEPEPVSTGCSAQYNSADDDGDGFTNADEIDNGSNPCSAASRPQDFDGDLISDLNDPDDDNDGLPDDSDYFSLDAQNGTTTNLPIEYDMLNNHPGTGLFGLGFTGLMLPMQQNINYQDLFQVENLIAGGAVGALSIINVSTGDPYQTNNNQENGFQFGVNVNSSTPPFTVQTRLLGPFFNNQTPQYYQSQGIFIGTGDQENYFKIVLGADGGAGGIEVLYENSGIASSTTYPLPGGLPTGTIDLYLSVNPATGMVQARYAKDGGQVLNLGPAIQVGGPLLNAIQGAPAMAVGIISTSFWSTPFTASWDFINIKTDSPTTTNTAPVLAAIGNKTATVGQPLTFTASAIDSDVPAQTLTYSVSGTTGATINAQTGAFSWTPSQSGDFTFTIKVTDSGTPALFDEESITVTVSIAPTNKPPVANAGPDKIVTFPATSVVLEGSGTDQDGTVDQYAWVQTSGPTTATYNSTIANPTVSGLVAGTYVFSLTVKDNKGAASSPDQVTVTVTSGGGTTTLRVNSGGGAFMASNNRQFAADGNFSGGSTYTESGKAIENTTDDALYQTERYGSFSYNVPVSSGTYNVVLHFAEIYFGVSGTGIRRFNVDIEGARKLTEYDITTKAGGALKAVKETFTVNVSDGTLNIVFGMGSADNPKVSAIEIVPASATTNQPPVVANAIMDQSATVGASFNFAFAENTFTDPDADGLTYSASLADGTPLPAWLSFNGSNLTFSGTPPAGSSGNIAITVTANDGKGGTASDSFLIAFVTPANIGTWQTIAPSSGAPSARHEGAYVQAGDKFYLMGGRGIKPVQVYDPVTKTWTNAASTPIELHHFQAVTLDGLIYVVGAFTGGYPAETPVPQVYIYDPKANQWLVGADIPADRRRGAAGVIVRNNKIYMVGGNTKGHNNGYVEWFDEFDPATSTWKVLPNAPRTRDHFHAAAIGDKLYAAGGRRSSANTGQVFSLTVPEVDVYDFGSGQWSTLSSPIPTQRGASTAAVLGGELVVIGGESSQPQAHNDTESYNPSTNAWQRLANMQQGRHATQAIVNNGAIYIVAGSGGQGGSPELSSQEVFYKNSLSTPTGTALIQSQLNSPSEVAFGQITASTTSSKTLTLTNNSGNQAILISSIAISGSNEFTSQAPFTLPFVIPVGGSATINLHFTPLSVGNKSATLTIFHSGAGGTKSVSLTGGGISGSNAAPVANAGADQAITLPVNSVTLNGTASDTDGSIASYQWSQQSGPNTATLTGANQATMSASNLVAGTYVFRLTATDNLGATAFDEATVTVNPAPTNQQAVTSFTLIDADTDQPIRDLVPNDVLNLTTLPTKYLNIRANTNPATVGSVKFVLSGAQNHTQTEGGAPYALFGDNSGNYNAWVLVLGDHTLVATPYTGTGASGTEGTPLTITFKVINQTSTNKAPTVNAGSDLAITLPVNSVTLNGTASDTDGNIASYQWSQQSGPNTATLTGANQATMSASNLVAGTYVFRLTATDNLGATAYDEVTITVNPAPTNQQAVASFTLINADTDQPIRDLVPNDVLNLATLSTKNLNIRAITSPSTVGSVKFVLSGTQSWTLTESVAPYAMTGDNSGNYNAWTPAVGDYSLTATPYTGASAGGTTGNQLTIGFTVINQAVGPRMSFEGTDDKEGIQVQIYPNPFTDSFTLHVLGKGEHKLPASLSDKSGRIILTLDDVQPEQTIQLGKEIAPGIYFLQIGTGRKVRQFKLLKIY
ncbi:PKD domain-containing protein [Telluribacter humicola]|uniref:PKD domain-containing protein n=1 Tax=Telluribacter humicola TaxID=1720261 RepID=UPI001A964D0A|nr:malectin domain-containing carbohydrate-binding protein [Telluribacter humicola]